MFWQKYIFCYLCLSKSSIKIDININFKNEKKIVEQARMNSIFKTEIRSKINRYLAYKFNGAVKLLIVC